MAKFLVKQATLLAVVAVFCWGQCSGNLFVNANYNKLGNNPYLAPVFNGSSAPEPQNQVVAQEVPLEASSNEENTQKNQAEGTEQPVLVTNEVVPPAVQADPAPAFQNPQNVYYPAGPTFIPPPQNAFGGVPQASFPSPNYSNNPYLQGFFPGSANQPQNPSVLPPPQNGSPFPAVAIQPPPQNPTVLPPPQNGSPFPAVAIQPPPPQNLAPPQQNPFLQNQTPSVPVQTPQVSPAPYPPQNQPQSSAGGFANNNNPYLQNLNPPAQAGPFFPSVPVSAVPQQPTQSYPTPCTYIPSGVPSQGVTYQPVAPLAGKNLRSRCLKPRGQFPSDKCNYFINCWDHDVREQPCPPGLAFSSKGYCDFEGNVDCNGLPLAAIPAAGNPGGSFVNQGSFVPVQAPSGQPALPAVAPTVQIPQDVQPTVQSIQPSNDQASQSSPSSIAASVPIVSNDVAVEIPSNPQANSVAVTIPAPYPEQQGSTFAPTAAPIPSTTVDPALKAKCLQPRGQFPTEICNRYINCWDHVVRMEECPKGMSFSEKGYCDFDFSVNCGNRTYDSKGSIEGNAECPTPHGTFRDKYNCSQYYTCMFGQIVARYGCAQGLSYNDMLGVCDYSQNVDCTHAPLVYPPTENHVVMQQIKEEAPNTSKCTPGSIYRLNPQCTSAVLCRYGFTEIVECPAGLAYDSVTDKCLLSHLAKC